MNALTQATGSGHVAGDCAERTLGLQAHRRPDLRSGPPDTSECPTLSGDGGIPGVCNAPTSFKPSAITRTEQEPNHL